jgi:hypothetical protein
MCVLPGLGGDLAQSIMVRNKVRHTTRTLQIAGLLSLLFVVACGTRNTPPKEQAQGGEKSSKTAALESGSRMLQGTTPIGQIDIYLDGFHPMKDSPSTQVEAHHFCHQLNEDFAQCVLFDGNTKDGRMNGIEYIVSEKLYSSLPAGEKQYWHPHNYEILSGELVAPGLPEAAEHALMAQKVNSYGKTWHLWMTGANGGPGDNLPLGNPHLAWSFNQDGEAAPAMVTARDQRMAISTANKREARADLSQYAHPQNGVNLLQKAFGNRGGTPKGVQDSSAK